MVKRRGRPQVGELVICKITRVNPHSAFAKLDEYGVEGMIHISEISSGWVKDIRQFVKKGQTVVAKVRNVDRDHVSLSLKRVDRKQENNKIKEHRLSQRAEKMLEIAAAELNKSLDDAYEEVGFMLQESFGSLYEAFRLSIQNPKALEERGVPKEWVEKIKSIAEKSITQKEFEFSAKLYVKTYKPGGVSIIKEVLAGAEKSGLEVRYIAAPEYLVKYRSMNAKKGEKEFMEKLGSVKSGDAEISFKIIK